MRTLLIVPPGCLPWPLDKSGGGQRSYLLREALGQFGEVYVVAATPRTTDYSSQVRQTREKETGRNGLREVFYNPARERGLFRLLQKALWGGPRRVAKNLAVCSADFSLPDRDCLEQLEAILREVEPDLLVCRYLRWAVATGGAFISGIPVLLDFDVVPWLVQATHEEQMAAPGTARRLHSRFYNWLIERNARKSLRRFAHVWVASEEDRDIVACRSCSVLPNVPLLPPREGSKSRDTEGQESGILFVGALTHGPNREGLDHFLDQIWPHIHAAEPGMKLRVAGPLPHDDGRYERRWRQVVNVDILGHVEDLSIEYERALFTIAPVYWGGGTKVKVLESLGRGKTCVLTPHAVLGLGNYVKDGESALYAANDAEFVQACLKLFRSAELRQTLAARGEEVIREHFSVKRFNDAVADVLSRFPEKCQGFER